MTTFKNAVKNTVTYTTTENGAVTFESSLDACVDLFSKIGSARSHIGTVGKLSPDFRELVIRALNSDVDVATRIVAYARDVRGGMGERAIYRAVLNFMIEEVLIKPQDIKTFVEKTPELGRWDDLLAIRDNGVRKEYAYPMIEDALVKENGLCAKWMPRKGRFAVELRQHMKMTPKQYRKTLVGLSDTVEQKMCAKKWGEINFSQVPSVASSRYRTAFYRNDDVRFTEFIEAANKGEVKINASAIFPHDVLRDIISGSSTYGKSLKEQKTIQDAVVAQWVNLPNYLQEDTRILPMIDVSGSMGIPISGGSCTAMEVAVATGLYFAEKQTGSFKDTYLTFSEKPQLEVCTGNVVQKIEQILASHWGMSTNLQAAFDRILTVAVKNDVPQEEMPTHLLILSDMEFNSACRGGTNFELAKHKFATAGYEIPNIVFWNINARNTKNAPVRFDERGTSLVSGYSPAIIKSILAKVGGDSKDIMLDAIMKDRYKIV